MQAEETEPKNFCSCEWREYQRRKFKRDQKEKKRRAAEKREQDELDEESEESKLRKKIHEEVNSKIKPSLPSSSGIRLRTVRHPEAPKVGHSAGNHAAGAAHKEEEEEKGQDDADDHEPGSDLGVILGNHVTCWVFCLRVCGMISPVGSAVVHLTFII